MLTFLKKKIVNVLAAWSSAFAYNCEVNDGSLMTLNEVMNVNQLKNGNPCPDQK